MSNLQNFRKLFTRPVHCASVSGDASPYIYAFFPKKIIYNKKHGTRKNS